MGIGWGWVNLIVVVAKNVEMELILRLRHRLPSILYLTGLGGSHERLV